MKKNLTLVLFGALLSACAVQKPSLPDDGYIQFPVGLMSLQKCADSGYITPDIRERAQKFVMLKLHSFQFDQNYFMSQVNLSRVEHAVSSVRISQGECNTLAVGVLQMEALHVKNQIDANNRSQLQMEQLSHQLQQIGQTFQNAGQQTLQQSRQYSAPQVQPITHPGAYGGTTYRRTGNTVMGTDGSSCQLVGQSILCSDGRRCQMIGENLICN